MSERPVLRVVRGEPTAEELAVLTAVVTAAASTGPVAQPGPQRGRWNDPFDQHHRPWQIGAGGWRAGVR